MFFRLFLLFFAVPFIDLMLLFRIGGRLGFFNTVALVLLTAVLGAWLTRLQGAGILQRITASLNQGKLPADEMVNGLFVFAAGLLLLTPGFLTDGVGFVFLMPPCRDFLKKHLMRMLKRHVDVRTFRGDDAFSSQTGREDYIDVEAEPVDDDRGEER